MQPKKAFKTFYILSAVMAIVAIVMFVIVVGLSIDDATNRPKGGKVDMPGSGTITLEDGGSWMVYFEFDSKLSDEERNLIRFVDIQVTDQSNNQQLYLDTEILGASYISGGVEGMAEYAIEVDEPTTVLVETGFDNGDGPDFRVNITRDTTTTILIGLGFAVLFGVLIFLVAFVLLIIGVVKHSNYNKKLREQNNHLPEY